MKRETIDMTNVPDIRNLVWEDSIYDENTNQILYDGVESTVEDINLEKCYKILRVVFQRQSDKKFFAFNYTYSPHWEDDEEIIAEEVFPREKIMTVYE